MTDLTMPEPPTGAYLLVGDSPEEILFVRDDPFARDNGDEAEHWFQADGGAVGTTWPDVVGDSEGRIARLYAEDDDTIAVLPDAPQRLRWGIRLEAGADGSVRIDLPPAAKVLTPAEAEWFGLELIRFARSTATPGGSS